MDPAAWAKSKCDVLVITRGLGYHRHPRDTRLVAFPLTTDTSSSLAFRQAMTRCGEHNDLCCLSETDAWERVELCNIYAHDSSRALSKRGQASHSSRMWASRLVFKTSCWTAGESECLAPCGSTKVARHPTSRTTQSNWSPAVEGTHLICGQPSRGHVAHARHQPIP